MSSPTYYWCHKALFLVILIGVWGCSQQPVENDATLALDIPSFTNASQPPTEEKGRITIEEDQWIQYDLDVKKAGRYAIEVEAVSKGGSVWIEDYVLNEDGRTYNITGKIPFKDAKDQVQTSKREGSPLNKGVHPIRIHASGATVAMKSVKFWPIVEHTSTPKMLKQEMSGSNWELAWSDEFDQPGLPDSTKWNYNIGDWGWGNNELQYYTRGQLENARVEDGNLVITAIKNDSDDGWSSARLTTQGRESFLYGKIEFRAKVPSGRGTWAAGWMLGDEYVDELSWPYCGEIDILECVGFEIDDSTGTGKNHATCHTRAYYFKQGNQIGSDTVLTNMTDSFHTYAVEWYPDVVYGLVDGKRYYTYDKNKNEQEWPFDKAQNIVLNLAMGGGWGGAKGVDSTLQKQAFIIDYVRVYELK